MRRGFICIGLILVLLFSSCSIADKISQINVGMTYDEFSALMQDKSVFYYGLCAFFEYEGKNVVVGFDGDDRKVIKKEVYADVGTAPASAFEAILPGMTVYEVVQLVGLPFRSATFGLSTLDFLCDNGDIYRVVWIDQMEVLECTKLEQ